jgi:hypothetical protein
VKSAARKFVVQEHTRCGNVHWDLMLESGNILQTWRLNTHPERIGNEPINASKIFDHDLKFLTYEGPVNKGLGSVSIVDIGTFEMLEKSEKISRLHFQGNILSGNFILEYIAGESWRFSKTQ